MVRKLPWERRSERPPLADSRQSSSPRPPPPPRNDSSPPQRTSASPREESNTVATRARSRSTSPPTAPPTESFMIPGMDNDGQYRMVEDELLSVAQTFTAHLHAAEYQRLKAAAKSRSAEAMQSISQQAPDEGSHSPWMGTSLQSLMEGDRKRPSLLPVLGSRPRAKDEAEEDDDDDDDDDDLDGPSTLNQPLEPLAASKEPLRKKPVSATAVTEVHASDEDTTDSDGSEDAGDLLQEMRQRRQREKERRQRRQGGQAQAVKEEAQEPTRLDIIPSFM